MAKLPRLEVVPRLEESPSTWWAVLKFKLKPSLAGLNEEPGVEGGRMILFHGSNKKFTSFEVNSPCYTNSNGEFKKGLVWLTRDIATALTFAGRYLYVVEVPREVCGKMSTKKCYDFHRSQGSQNCYLAPQGSVRILHCLETTEYGSYPKEIKELFKTQLERIQKFMPHRSIYREWYDCVVKGMTYEESLRASLFQKRGNL